MRPKLLTALVLLLSTLYVQAQTPKKLALIIAISKYAPSTGWDDLSSANDIKLISTALKQQGFLPENIAVITDKKATLKGIVDAIDKDLIGKITPGDVAVLHFSGHGQQMTDDNGDEGDGLDEALVPYDAPLEYAPGVNKHLRDDIMEKKLTQVRQALGENGSLLVLVDACHSGTSTRGNGKMRGTAKVYGAGVVTANQRVQTATEKFGVVENDKKLAPMAAFFASSAFQQNQEASLPEGNAGSLSVAFTRALSRAQKNTTYRALFEDVKVEMSSLVMQQTPMAEGDLDYTILGGQALGKPEYYMVKKDAMGTYLPTGTIYGVFGGTTIKLFKPDTRDTAGVAPLATGKITEAGLYTANIELDKKLSDDELKKAWVYLDAINYGDLGVKVKINVADQLLVKSLTTILNTQIKQAKLVSEAADLFLEQNAENVEVKDASGALIARFSQSLAPEKMAAQLAEGIGNFARANFLRNLPLKNEEYKVSVNFVPVKCVAGCDNPRTRQYEDDRAALRTDVSGNVVFKEGDRFRLDIINHSDQNRLYYTVLDIQPDNKVNVLIPGEGQSPEEFFISQQDTIRLKKYFTIGPPYGVDAIKVIASDVPMNLREIFATKGAPTRSASNPFEKLVKDTYKTSGTKTRGSGEDVIQPDAANIVTIPYKIEPKQ